MPIHPTAVIDKTAEIDPSADIGAYAIVEPHVAIGAETRLFPHVYVSTGTTIGRRCQLHPFAVVGHPPQDLKWTGAPSYTRIGDDVIVREGATIHRGAMPESTTIVGNRVYMMAYAHVGHNCVIEDGVIMVNGTQAAGHVEVGPRAFLSANSMFHQFVRIGELVMVRGGLKVVQDVPPFMMCRPAGVVQTNVIGLRRAGFSREERQEIRQAYKTLYRSGIPFREAIAQVAATVKTDPGRRLAAFLQAPSQRGYLGYREGVRRNDVDENPDDDLEEGAE